MTDRWETLNMFEVDEAASAGVKGKASKLRKRVEKLNADRATLDSDIAAFRGEPDAKALAADGFEQSRALRIRRVELLQAEVELRKAVGELRLEYQDVLRELWNDAFENEQKVHAEVMAGLVDLGFDCGPDAEPEVRRRHEGFCRGNLRFRQALGRKDEIAYWRQDTDYSRSNDAATKAVTDELQRIRQQLTKI